jgi:uncharacterized membrane protein (UPF0127 family)
LSGTAPLLHRVRDVATGAVLADRLRAARTHWTRLKGLLGTRSLEPGQGLWIVPCRQVHMFGMRYPLDVVFLDQRLRVVHTIDALAPGAVSPKVREAASVLELPAGTLQRLGVVSGAQLEIDGGPDVTAAAGGSALWVLGLVAGGLLVALSVAAHARLGPRAWWWLALAPLLVQQAVVVLRSFRHGPGSVRRRWRPRSPGSACCSSSRGSRSRSRPRSVFAEPHRAGHAWEPSRP